VGAAGAAGAAFDASCTRLRALASRRGGARAAAAGAAELLRVAVVPDLRRRGVARALVAHCERFAAECGYKRMFLTTLATMAGANELYTAAGYALLGARAKPFALAVCGRPPGEQASVDVQAYVKRI